MKMELSVQVVLVLSAVGLCAGMLSGFVGVGGGLVIVPALVYLLGYSQLQAQGTSLAVLLLPVGFLAVWKYYKEGNVNTSAALIIGAAFVLGAFFGSKYAHRIPDHVVKFVFGLFMLFVAIKMLVNSGSRLFQP